MTEFLVAVNTESICVFSIIYCKTSISKTLLKIAICWDIERMSRVVRKPVFAICEQQRRCSACTSTQSEQSLGVSLPG